MNVRSAQVVAAALGVLLVALVGFVAFVLLSRPSTPGPTASPSSVAAASASPTFSAFPIPTPAQSASAAVSLTPAPISPAPSLAPTPVITFPTPAVTTTPLVTPTPSITPTPFVTESPAVTPTPELSPSPSADVSPTPSVVPSPTPSGTPIVPTSPARSIRVNNLGVDDRTVDTSIQRFIEFGVDGPGVISARTSNSTGRVQVCIWRGSMIQNRVCETFRNGVVEVANPVVDPPHTNWTVTVIGTQAGATPTVDLTIDFNADGPATVRFDRLRFNGTSTPAYNGLITLVSPLAGGNLTLDGAFDDGQNGSYSAHVVIEEMNGSAGTVFDETLGPGRSFDVTQAVTSGVSYRISATNPSAGPEPRAVFLALEVRWP